MSLALPSPGYHATMPVGGAKQVAVTATQAENSDVSPVASVAVAVMLCPLATATGRVALIVALPEESVGTFTEPRKTCPSPLPDGSHEGFEKNSTRKVAPTNELSVP